MFTILLYIVVAVATLYFQIKKYLKSKASIQKALANAIFNSEYFGKFALFLFGSIFIFGIGSGIYGAIVKDTTSWGLALILISVSIGELLQFRVTHQIYFNEDAIIVNGILIRYRSIKEVKSKSGLNKNLCIITTNNGDMQTTTIHCFNKYISKHTKLKLR